MAIAAVLGGAGEVGEGIVRRLLAEGWGVVVPSRGRGRVDALRERLGAGDDLVGIEVDVGTDDGAQAFADALASADGKLRAVVAALGGWWSGPRLVDVDPVTWRQILEGGVTAHFLAARALLPLLRDRAGASYTLINGSGGLAPVVGSGPVSVSAAGQLMLADALAAEHADDPVRINSLVIGTPVISRSRPRGRPGWLTADEVGAYQAWLCSDAARDVDGQRLVFDRAEELDALAGRSGR